MKSPEGDKGVQNSAHVGKARDLGQNSDEGNQGGVKSSEAGRAKDKTVVQNSSPRGRVCKILQKLKTATL